MTTRPRHAWMLLCPFPLGFGAWVPLVAGLRARRPVWVALGILYCAVLVVGFVLASVTAEDEDNSLAGMLILIPWAAAVATTLAIYPSYGRRRALLDGVEEREDEIARRDRERERARELVRSDPVAALERGIGRPDLPDADHGDLVDVNHAPPRVLVRFPASTPTLRGGSSRRARTSASSARSRTWRSCWTSTRTRRHGSSASRSRSTPSSPVRVPPMIVERSMHPDWLSNTYLVAAAPGGEGFLVDAGGPVRPLLDKAESDGFAVTHVLLTHHHHDHVAELGAVTRRFPDAQVLIHPDEREFVDGATGDLNPGDELSIGGLTVRAVHTPGHTRGMISLVVDGQVFTGDTLFKNSVGGVRAPGHTTYADLKRSIMDVLLELPPETTIRPGHTDPTTVAEERENNAFVRVWRGLDPEGSESCTAMGEPATLVLLGDDYDGGHKAWVRWEDGSDDIVPGSQVSR